jgi:hypothetical protein
MPPAYVKPYVKRQKNDTTDAEAICEAVTRSNMRFVPKTLEKQGCMVLHPPANCRHQLNSRDGVVRVSHDNHVAGGTSPPPLVDPWIVDMMEVNVRSPPTTRARCATMD